jgi:hypothetical protein
VKRPAKKYSRVVSLRWDDPFWNLNLACGHIAPTYSRVMADAAKRHRVLCRSCNAAALAPRFERVQ